MRSSRRNKNLEPEFEPEPTPPPSEEERSFEIETEEEEQIRRNREDALEEIRMNRTNKSTNKSKKSKNKENEVILNDIVINEELNDNEELEEELRFSDENDSDSNSSIEEMTSQKQNISVEIAKMALAMGNTKIVEQFLKSLSDNTNKKVPSSNNIDSVYNNSGKVLTSGLRGFSKYWNEHLTKLDLNFKLTMFNDRWIELDHMVEGGNTSKKKDKPTGLIPKSEWWMSYADWTRAKTLMLKYLRQTYFHVKFANDLEKHFDYVENLSLRHGWLTAFRYDILVRTDVMCNRVDGASGDPKIPREIFLEEAKARTELLRDGRIILLDNPYAKGNVRERFNPVTGRQYLEGLNHDSVEIVMEENDNTRNIMNQNQNNNNNNYLTSFQRNDQFKRNDGFQNNRRNNRRNINRERSPTPYQHNEKPKERFIPNNNKGKQVDRSQFYIEEEPRQSTSKDKQT